MRHRRSLRDGRWYRCDYADRSGQRAGRNRRYPCRGYSLAFPGVPSYCGPADPARGFVGRSWLLSLASRVAPWGDRRDVSAHYSTLIYLTIAAHHRELEEISKHDPIPVPSAVQTRQFIVRRAASQYGCIVLGGIAPS